MIGCVAIVEHEGKIVAIDTTKGRGITLPGGKWESHETFAECAKRELFEETGLVARNFKYVFAGQDGLGYYVYAFTAVIDNWTPRDSPEGRVVLADYSDLRQSTFKAYYAILHELGHL